MNLGNLFSAESAGPGFNPDIEPHTDEKLRRLEPAESP